MTTASLARVDISDVAAAVTAVGLPDVDRSLPDEPLDDWSWSQLLDLVERHRVTGFLAWAVSTGRMRATERQLDEVHDAHVRGLALALILERRLLLASRLLSEHGIELRVLKGPGLAHTSYPDPAWRLYGDIDLLVRPRDIDRAIALLCDNGYTRPVAEPRPGFDRRYGKGATLIDSSGYELDLHRSLVFGAFGLTIDLDELFEGGTPFHIAGQRFLALAPEQRLLHACYHAALSDARPRLLSLRDVAQLLSTGGHDPGEVRRLVERWRGRAVVTRAVHLLAEHLRLSPDDAVSRWARSYEPTPAEVRAIHSHTGTHHRFAGKVRAAVPFIPGIRGKIAFIRALLLPSRPFLQQRPEGYVAWIRRGLRSLRDDG